MAIIADILVYYCLGVMAFFLPFIAGTYIADYFQKRQKYKDGK
jgi:hypothetical protein